MLKYMFNPPKPSSSNYDFKLQYSFNKRKLEGENIRKKYSDKIPVVIERANRSDIADIDKHKFLVHQDFTIAQFLYFIRKRIKLSSKQSIFLFVNNETIPRSSDTFEEIYKKYVDKDNFLYITYASENTFG